MSEANLLEDSPALSPQHQGNLTQGPILRTLLLFSVPTMVTNVLQTLGSTINTVWVGQLLGEGALAATANANMVIFLAFATVFGFGMATTVKVGHHIGAYDYDGARRAFGTGTGFCSAAAILSAIAGWIYADELLRVLATPAAIHADALIYLRIMFLSMPFSTIATILSMGMRGAGDPKTPLYAMLLTTLIGIVLNPLLILGFGPVPAMGIGGSALALAIASFLGTAAMIAWTYWRDLPLRLKGRELLYLIPGGESLSYVLAKGLPLGAQMLVTSSASLIMIGLVNREGMLTAAAYGALLQIWNYIQMPAFSISTGVTAMVAQNIGAGQHDRVGRITMAGVGANVVITLLLTGLVLAFDAPLLKLFLPGGSGAIEIAEHIQLLATWSWVLMGLMMVLGGTLRAYGVVVLPLVIMGIALYVARLGFYELMRPTLGADALWWSFPFGSAVALVLTWLVYGRLMGSKARGEGTPVPVAAE